jgi:uncharacterized RDD family membrane protein YckC
LIGTKANSNWLTIPAADPQALTSSVADALRVYGNTEATGALYVEEASVPDIHLVPADRWRRLVAAALDLFVLVGLLCTVALAQTAHLEEGEKPDDVFLYALVVAVSWVIYMWVSNMAGMSLGKLAVSLRIVRAGTEHAPGPVRGTVRSVVAGAGYLFALVAIFFTPMPIFYVGTAVLGIGFLWSIVDPTRRAVHDIAAGTRVVQTSVQPTATHPAD